MSAEWRRQTPPLLGEIADHAALALVEALGLSERDADYAGYLVARRLAETLGGATLYMPKADALERHDRDVEIWRAFSGRNHVELARQHGVTTIHIYRIIRQMRAREGERVQPRLPLGLERD